MSLFLRGIIRGPYESEEAFKERLDRATPAHSHPQALSITQKLFSFAPDWVEIRFINKGLWPWEGAATFIEENGVRVQLRAPYLHKTKLYGIYDRDELIAHELVHAARLAFHEPQFEEILAYQTSSSPFRKYWGPLWRSSYETLACFLSLSLAFVNPLYTTTLLVIPLYFVGRLIRLQTLFKRAQKRYSLSELVCMTDKQIKDAACAG